jgi:ankyrin repeat protein
MKIDDDTLLHFTAKSGHLEIVKTLIENEEM